MLKDFYKSRSWEKLIKTLKAERINEFGQNVCMYCGKPIIKKYDCIAHHKIYLTEENYEDANIALNPENIELVHHACHNNIHEKLKHGTRKIYIVYGAPLSGKTSYVNSVRLKGDLILDIDNIWECVSGDRYIKDGRLKNIVFHLRDEVLKCLKYKLGFWLNAYIVGSYPLLSERERLSKELGADLIYIDSNKEECLKRLYNDSGGRDVDAWKQYINDWFDKYTPPHE